MTKTLKELRAELKYHKTLLKFFETLCVLDNELQDVVGHAEEVTFDLSDQLYNEESIDTTIPVNKAQGFLETAVQDISEIEDIFSSKEYIESRNAVLKRVKYLEDKIKHYKPKRKK